MTVEKLKIYLEKEMRMSHIYQPYIIKQLLQKGDDIDIKDIAADLGKRGSLSERVYESRLKNNPIPRLIANGIIFRENNKVSLSIRGITLKEKENLIKICDIRMNQFVKSRIYNASEFKELIK